MGRAPRVLSGWVPTPDDPSEWNQNQREMMFALMEAEKDICPGCGSFLSFSTRQDHGHSVTRRQCETCAAIAKANKDWDKNDARLEDTPEAWTPSARRVSSKPIPLRPEDALRLEMAGVNLGPREDAEPETEAEGG